MGFFKKLITLPLEIIKDVVEDIEDVIDDEDDD